MNTGARPYVLVAWLMSLPAFGGEGNPPPQPPTLTDAKVVQMVQSKMSSDLIILEISKCTPKFALDPASTQYMTENGVTDEILSAMTAKQNGQPFPGSDPPTAAPPPAQTPPPPPLPAAPGSTENRPRVFMASASKGNQWNAHRDQSMELSKDFEQDCPGVRITLNQQIADYTVSLNHIEVGAFYRDNQFQIADHNGDLLTRTKEGGSIRKGAKRACAIILEDWANHGH